MSDPEVFYNREDLWTVASELSLSDSGDQQTQAMEPNYVLMKLPGASSIEFVEILPFTPANRNNLIGWIAGRSDGAHYGTAVVYDFPKTRLVDGPMQIEARIDQNAAALRPAHALEPAGLARRAVARFWSSPAATRCSMPSPSICRPSKVPCRSCVWWCSHCRTGWRTGPTSRRPWQRSSEGSRRP